MDAIWNLLIQQGVSPEELVTVRYIYLLLLLLPIVVTIIGIFRYIIGLRSLNFYIPLFLTFIFLEFGKEIGDSSNILKGLGYGVILFFMLFLSSTLLYRILKRFRMHYIPKISLIIIGASLTTAVLIFISVYFDRTRLLAVNPFTIIVLVTAAEGFISVYAKKNFRYALSLAVETLFISVISYLFISQNIVQNFVLNNPLIIIALVVINIYVGRFLGLRLTEYWRFRTILLQPELSNDEPTKSDIKK